MRHRVCVRLDFREQPRSLQPVDDLLARNKTLEPVISQCFIQLSRVRHIAQECLIAREIKVCLDVEHVHDRQIVAPAHLEIVEVVSRSDLDRASALLRIGIFVGNDRNATSD